MDVIRRFLDAARRVAARLAVPGERGASAVEYGILLLMILLGVIALAAQIGDSTKEGLTVTVPAP